MDKRMVYMDLADSAGKDGYFAKTLTPFTDDNRRAYEEAFRALEKEGLVMLKECGLQDFMGDKVLVVKGFIT